MRFTAVQCSFSGFEQKRATLLTAKAMSGFVHKDK